MGAALAGLQTDIPLLTAEEFSIATGCLTLLFSDVSVSKVIPLKMLKQSLEEDIRSETNARARELGGILMKNLKDKLGRAQSTSVKSVATLLDPRFKTIGFFSPTKATREQHPGGHYITGYSTCNTRYFP